MVRELNFTLEGVQGDLKLEYGPFKQRLYQDGREIERQGRFNPKYYVTNTNGEKEEIKIVYGFDFVHVAVFRGQKIDLEERLSTREYIVGGLPVLLIFLGGLIGAVFGFVGASIQLQLYAAGKVFHETTACFPRCFRFLLCSLFHIWDLLQFTDKRIGKKINEAAPSLFRCAAFFRVAFIILAHFSSFSTADSY